MHDIKVSNRDDDMRKYLALWLVEHGEGVTSWHKIGVIDFNGNTIGLPTICLACIQEGYIQRVAGSRAWADNLIVTKEGKEFLNKGEKYEQ